MLFHSKASLTGSLSRDLREQTEARKPEKTLGSTYSGNSRKANMVKLKPEEQITQGLADLGFYSE